MSFTNQTLKSGPYATNGSTTAFSGTFYCLAESQLAVTLTDSDGVESTLVLTTDYTVSGTFPTSSFTVNTVATQATGQTITISRATDLTQESSFGNSGPYLPKTHETAFDKSMTAIQEVQEEVDRCVKNAVSSTSSIDSAEYLAACETAASQAAASAATVTQSATRTVALRATADVDVATGLVAGQSIDGVVLVAADRVMLDLQSTATEDGIYVAVAAGAGTRASDWAVGDSVGGSLVTVTEGTANAGFIFLVENVDGSDVVGTDGLTLGVQLKSISADDKHLVRRAGTVVEETCSVAAATVLDDASVAAMATTLGIGTPDDSSLELSTDTLQVKALGITDAMLAGSITAAKMGFPTCKAWGRFDGTGTPSFDREEGMASIADIGTGEYRITLDVAVSANACVLVSGKPVDDESRDANEGPIVRQTSTTTFYISTGNLSAGVDWEVVYVAIFE